MSEWLEKFFQAADWPEVVDPARELSVRNDPADVPPLLAALDDPIEARRWGAVYALGFSRRDGRVIAPLIRALLNEQETPRVRAQAAECLGMLGKRKAMKALIQCSADESAEVRFWCVFAMGQYRWRRRKAPRAVVCALEARLDDGECPDGRGNWWTVGLEALAMLCVTDRRHPASGKFRDTLLHVLKDPLSHPDQWQWASEFHVGAEPEVRDLLDVAVRTIQEAGFDPVSFGRQKTDQGEAEPAQDRSDANSTD